MAEHTMTDDSSAMNRFLSVQAEIKNAEAALANLRLELDRIREQSPIVNQMSTKNALLNMALSDKKAFQDSWKAIVERGLYQNISSILSDCLLVINPDSVGQSVYDAAMERTGVGSGTGSDGGSEPDVRFVLPLIRYMKSKGLFGTIWGVKGCSLLGLNDFSDTAGGCDEILWNAMVEFLKVPNWKPWDFAEEAAMVAAKTAAMAEKAAAKTAAKTAAMAEKAAIKAELAAAKAAEKAAKKAEKAAIKAELAAAKKAAHNANAV
jgi:hypothetical protein